MVGRAGGASGDYRVQNGLDLLAGDGLDGPPVPAPELSVKDPLCLPPSLFAQLDLGVALDVLTGDLAEQRALILVRLLGFCGLALRQTTQGRPRLLAGLCERRRRVVAE